jgi:uncharacterized protein
MALRGAVAVVTGASSGIGWSTAWALAGRGATVVVSARRPERLSRLAAEIRARGGVALDVACDVGDLDQVDALLDAVMREFGRCDVLVNNAGIPGGGSFTGTPTERLEATVRTNLLGVIYVTKALLPSMLEAGKGHVVNVASLAGRFAVPGAAVYSATKHAVVALSESLHHEVSSSGVLVTAVNPGLVRTEGFPHPDRRLGVMRPERVARVIVSVVEKGRAPEVSVPRSISAMQVWRVITPGLYQWGLGRWGRAGPDTGSGGRPGRELDPPPP